jgi:drug/metabolite transporter (DMT)-like permease
MALEKIPVSVARPMADLCVFVTALLGLFLLGETLTITQYVGIGLAIVAIMLLSG